jgi:hypothetical protein
MGVPLSGCGDLVVDGLGERALAGTVDALDDYEWNGLTSFF